MRNQIGFLGHTLVCLPLLLTLAQGQTVAQATHPETSAQRASIVEGYGRLPLAFEANQGQIGPQVKFVSRGAGYNLFLTTTEAVLTLHRASRQESNSPTARALPPQEEQSAVLRMKLVGANAKTEVSGQNELPGKSNYFIGNDPKKWHSNVRQYASVRYANVYPGVDLIYYGSQRELEYDFVLQPGANPGAIRLEIEGASKLRLDRGDLVLSSPGGDVRLFRPHTYQEVNGIKQEIRGRYVLRSKNEVGFRVSGYDRTRALIIDPVLAYSTYLGGSRDDPAIAIAVDSAGDAYVTGYTTSPDFPTANAFQPAYGGGWDVFVTKVNADGSALVYSTYLGGYFDEGGQSIAVDSTGVYLTGWTTSIDFPTVNPIQANLQGMVNAFVTKITAAGNALVYSTYLGGGEDYGWGIAVDSFGNAHVAGDTRSLNFPVINAIQPNLAGSFDTFVSKFNADGSALLYSTFWGGSGGEGGSRIAVDPSGDTYVGGYTSSPEFPIVNAVQPQYGGGGVDAYVTKFSADGQSVIYSTFLGGSGDDLGWDFTVDRFGNAYIAGLTNSSDFPTVYSIQGTHHGGWDAFLAKINAAGTALVYSTYLGGSGDDLASGIAADGAGNAYVVGYTLSTDFPVAKAIQIANRGGRDAFVASISAAGNTLIYSTYLGGSGNDGDDRAVSVAAGSAGSAYVAGGTWSKNFPTTLLAFQRTAKGDKKHPDAFVAKIGSQTFVGISKFKLGFSNQLVGTTSKPAKISLTNTGPSVLTISQMYVAGKNAGDFAQTNDCGASVAPGATCTISVTFTPTAKGMRAAVLGISDSDPASPQAIALSGTGTIVSLSKASLSFANQTVGTTSAPRSVTLTNVGSTQLNFTGITITGANAGDFAQTNTCGTSIAGGASCTITVTFKPTAKGYRKAAVSLSDDGGGSPQKVTLTGTGS